MRAIAVNGTSTCLTFWVPGCPRQRPAPPLSDYVESLWYARGRIDYGSEAILPTGNAVLLVNLGSPHRCQPGRETTPHLAREAWLCGVQTGAMINEPPTPV